jgi:hypothetical protein
MNKIGFQVSAIEWDLSTDDDSAEPTDLPSVVEVWRDDVEEGDLIEDGRGRRGVSSENLLNSILDEVTDHYGWCINNCTVTVIGADSDQSR